MNKFLSCDWGTSSFRLKLVDTEKLEVIAEEDTGQGVAIAHANWKATGKADRGKRWLFYLNIINSHVEKIKKKQKLSLKGVPLVVSGMASSSIGMEDLPYQTLPFNTDGSDIGTAYFEANIDFQHPILLISGVKSENDVMRGEETQLIGAITYRENTSDQSIFIFPGTHSKHIMVSGKQVVGFKTYTTGECFALLSEKSILKTGVKKGKGFENGKYEQSFKQGVLDAVGTNLLHTIFHVRTNELFGKLTKKENFNYLSGLLIGTELQEIAGLTGGNVYLCCNSHLKPLYEAAFDALGHKRSYIFSAGGADEAVIRGHLKIYNHFKSK